LVEIKGSTLHTESPPAAEGDESSSSDGAFVPPESEDGPSETAKSE
jgi:hypothetical protein